MNINLEQIAAIYYVETDPNGIRAVFRGEGQGSKINIVFFFNEKECEKLLDAVAYAKGVWEIHKVKETSKEVVKVE